MARQVASSPLNVSLSSELLSSCERVQASLGVCICGRTGVSLLLIPSSFLAVDSFLLGPSVPLFLHLLVGLLLVFSPKGDGMEATSHGTRLLCRLGTGLGMGLAFSEGS